VCVCVLQSTSAIRLNPVLGVAPLGPQSLDRVHIFQLEMLESAARHLPHPSDSQRVRYDLIGLRARGRVFFTLFFNLCGIKSATRHFVWLVRLPGTVSHWTFVPYLHYQCSKTCSRRIFYHVPTSLTNCFAANIVQRPCSDASHVTAPYKLLLDYNHYYY